jgi:coenzyme F420-dependent glucose-6-phosphate dehydrogenase
MTSWGYTLSSEEHPPEVLVRCAQRAEAIGFDFLTVSDHYHPWIGAQGQSPFVWTTLGAVAATTTRIRAGTGVTCPILRIHPAIIAHAAATTARLFGDRFFFGVGTGENLNEHVTGLHWPVVEQRQDMLREAIALMRQLWAGDSVDFFGDHYTVENARIYTRPDVPPPVIVSAFGPKSVQLAAEVGDGLWSVPPSSELLQQYADAGGTGMRVGQVSLCWAATEDEARDTVYEIWPNSGVPGQLSQDLPTPSHFEQACQLVTREKASESTPCGPDPEPVLEQLRQYEEVGYDHVHVHQIGPDQDGFFDFWEREIVPRL